MHDKVLSGTAEDVLSKQQENVMAADVQHDSSSDSQVRHKFDQILGRHMERLIGIRYGIGGLPINSMTVSCLILLMERENEIESFPSASSERYTQETLCNELEEMGFELNKEINKTVRELLQKGYIQVEEERLIPEKPAVSMTRLLDKAFPQMPGMNLVAYFIQTMDEVKSNRKDLESAVGQFDQTLLSQGIVLKNSLGQTQRKIESSPSAGSKNRSIPADNIKKDKPQVSYKRAFMPSEALERPKVENRYKDAFVSPSEPKILSSDYSAGKAEIRKVDFGGSAPAVHDLEENVPESQTEIKSEESMLPEPETVDKQDLSGETVVEDTPVEQDDTLLQVPLNDLESAKQKTGDSTPVDSEEQTAPADSKPEVHQIAEIEAEAGTGSDAEVLESDDDFIEGRIAAFEDDLAMECPICRRAKVKAENTARGKSYYKCSGKSCNFISWGKPYHLPCPQCNNPFLVESSDKAERLIFKCPRATCRYWQKPPWEGTDNPKKKPHSTLPEDSEAISLARKPRKRVVKRRRRVRRKK